MDRSWWWRLALVVGVTLGSIWFLMPTYYSLAVLPREQRNNAKLLEERMPKWAPSPHYRLNLGLDLQGGIHMILRVDTRTALQKRVERRGIQMVNYLREQKLGEVTAEANPEQLQLTLTAQDPSMMDAIEKEVAKWDDLVKVSRNGPVLVLGLNEARAKDLKDQAVDQAMLVIRRRIDKWGVAEVDVRKLSNEGIQISLPGQQNPETAKGLIGKTAQLEFRMVDDTNPFFATTYAAEKPPEGAQISLESGHLVGKDREALLAYVKGKAPADREVLLECVKGANAKKDTCDSYRAYLLDKKASITGDSLASADATMSDRKEWEVAFSFDAQGGRDFATLTEQNVGRRMAIVLDGVVQSAPVIRGPIPNGRGVIQLGDKTSEEQVEDAKTLALVLKAGALPAPVIIGEIRQVGATLGDDMIRKGSLAALVGLALVVLFMGIYYKVTGLIADLALVLNGALILAGLSLLNATLTLPGIAGFVLTLGIAVDANVLINERIREELANGRSARAAVDQGYDRAFWTIFDAHVTTLIAGLILSATGTGPVKGFAMALIIGIIASLFTSIVVTRVLTTYLVHGRNAERVSV